MAAPLKNCNAAGPHGKRTGGLAAKARAQSKVSRATRKRLGKPAHARSQSKKTPKRCGTYRS